MFAATAAALLTGVGCQKTPNGPSTGGEVVPAYKDAYYYGEGALQSAGSATYRINLYDQNNPATTLRLDVVSDVAVSDNIKPAATTYNLGSKEEPQIGTFIVAASASDEYGTLFTDNGTPVLITGGTIRIQQGVGIQQVTASLTTEAGETIEWTFKGSITYTDKRLNLDRTEIIVGSDKWDLYYEGEYASANGLGIVYLSVASEDLANILSLAITIPLPEDPNKVTVPEGTFTVAERPSEAGMLIAGDIQGQNVLYTKEVFYNTSTQMMNGGSLINSGSATITKNSNGTYSLTTNLSGQSFNNSGSITGIVDKIQYTMNNAEFPEFIDNASEPMSTLTEDVEVPAMPNFYADPLSDPWAFQNGSTYFILWRLIFSEGVELNNENDDYSSYGTLYVRGTEGKALSVQLVTETPTLDNISVPVGTFPLNEQYINLQSPVFTAQTTLSGAPSMTDPFGLGSGTFYFVIGQVPSTTEEGAMITSVVDGGGAVINKGQTTITSTGENTYELTIEFYDTYGHKITSTQTFEMSAAAASQAVVKNLMVSNGYLYNPALEPFANSPFAKMPAAVSLR